MTWIKYLIDIIYPKTCEACGETLLGGEKLICTQCLIDLPRTNAHKQPQVMMERRFWGKTEVSETWSFLRFSKKGKVQRLLHQLKYKNKPELGIMLGELYGRDLKQTGAENKIDLIVGVPLYKAKEVQRGYNQADCIAEGLSKALNVPFSNTIAIKTTSSSTQTKKGRFERFLNVMGTFEITDKASIAGKRIAIVDDVLTTGATIEALATALLASGCAEIIVVTLAVAD